MGKVAPLASAEVLTSKKGKRTAYLVGMSQKRGAPRVYAVIAPSVEAALAELAGLTTDRMVIEVVGGLSPDLTRRLGMKPGEMWLL